MDEADEALLDFVNGKGINGDKLLLIVQAGYLVLTDAAFAKLKELKGAIHDYPQPVKI